MGRNFALRTTDLEEYLIDYCMNEVCHSSFRDFVIPRIRELICIDLDLPVEFGMSLADWVLCELVRLNGLKQLYILSENATFNDNLTFEDWVNMSIKKGKLNYKTYAEFMVDFDKVKFIYSDGLSVEKLKEVFDREDIYYE